MAVEADQVGVPLELRGVFGPQRAILISLLRSLSSDEWSAPTVCTGWAVRDVVAHLLGGLAARVATRRDAHLSQSPRSGEPLEEFIDRHNEQWVVACRRLSPRILVDAIEAIGPAHDDAWWSWRADEASLGVSWAGIDPSPVWLDAAREVSECWVHEQQIREAIGKPVGGVPDKETVLDVFARGLPHALQRRALSEGAIVVRVTGTGQSWALHGAAGRWRLLDPRRLGDDAVEFALDGESLWRRWTRQAGVTVHPPSDPLARAVFDHVAIVHSAPD